MAEQPPNTIRVILTTTMATQSWFLDLPTRVAVQAIIAKIIHLPDMDFREQDDNGRRVPYRIMWNEGNRMLQETETLERAGVQPDHTLVMTHQARAGEEVAPG